MFDRHKKTTFEHKLVGGKPVIVQAHRPTKAQKKSASTLIPFTPGPGKSKAKRIARNLWG